MRIMITGASGLLGRDLVDELLERYNYDVELFIPSHEVLDITNHDEVMEYIMINQPDIIFHLAAYTAVDKAEDECKLCYDINVNGTKNIKEGAEKVSAKLIYISTDYVFDGNKEGIYYVDDEANPQNVYGKTKLLGEQIALEYDKTFVARTSWVFGLNGNNFIRTMLKLARERDYLTVVDDQKGSPTYTKDLAHTLVDMSETNKYGIYHVNNDGYVSWYELACFALEYMNQDIEVKPVSSAYFKTKAKRPLNSCLDHECLVKNGFSKLPSWQDAVVRYCEELKKQKNKTLER